MNAKIVPIKLLASNARKIMDFIKINACQIVLQDITNLEHYANSARQKAV
jgi:hypothetical protein